MQKLILEHGGDYRQKIPDASVDRVVIASEWKGGCSVSEGKFPS